MEILQKLLVGHSDFLEKSVKLVVKSNDIQNEEFEIKLELRQVCVVLPWLFNVNSDEVNQEGESGVHDALL